MRQPIDGEGGNRRLPTTVHPLVNMLREQGSASVTHNDRTDGLTFSLGHGPMAIVVVVQ